MATLLKMFRKRIWTGMDPNSAVAGSHVSCPKTREEGLNPNFGPSVLWTKKKKKKLPCGLGREDQ